MYLKANTIASCVITGVISFYALILASPALSVAIKSLVLLFLYLIPVFFLIRNRFVKVTWNKFVVFYFLFSFLITVKDLVLYSFGELSSDALNFTFLRLFSFITLYFLACNISMLLEIKLFFFSMFGALALFFLSFFVNVDLSGNVILMLSLLALISLRSYRNILFLSSFLVFVSLFLESRTGLIIILLYVLHVSLLKFKLYSVYWLRIVVFILALFVFFQIFISIYHYDDFSSNTLLTKRPYIWGLYMQESLNSVHSFLIGHGKITNDFASAVGLIISEEFGNGRNYSAHSFYINFIYEHGVIFSLLFMILVLSVFYCRKEFIIGSESGQALVFFLIAGLVIPMYLGGNSIFDIVLTYLLIRVIVLDESNSSYH